MSWLHRIGSIWRSRNLDRDLNDELRFHIEMRAKEHLAAGMTPEEARRAAERQFGNAALIKDRTRDVNVARWMESGLQDTRYAARSLRKNPAFASIAIAVLALGIGANSAMFSVVNAVLLKPLPYANPDRLFYLTTRAPRFNLDLANTPLYGAWREQTQFFENAAAYTSQSKNLVDKDPERVTAGMVTASFLPTLGIQPVLGRGINPDEDRPGGPHAAVLTHSFFERKFHGEASVLGKTIDLDDQPYTVVGVMGADFRFPQSGDYDLLVPLAQPTTWAAGSGGLIVDIVARVRPGIEVERMRADLTIVYNRQPNHGPRGTQVKALRLDRAMVGDHRTVLLILLGAVGFVLLIACGNVANLLLGRAAARQREVAVRAALGAGRGRLIRQFLTESLLLSLMGAGLGLLLARYAIRGLIALGGSRVPFIEQTAIDPAVLAFTAGVAILAGIFFGTVPSIAASSLGFFETLKRSGVSATASASHRRFRGALVVAEIALSLVLLLGAGLTIKSLWIMQNRDPGFQPENVLLAEMTPNAGRYQDKAKRLQFLKQVAENLQAVPGVAASAIYMDRYMSGGFAFLGKPAPPPGSPFVTYVPVSADFFHAMGIRLERGELFREGDTQCRAELNQTTVRAFSPDQDPIGLEIGLAPDGARCTVAGIVSDSSDGGLGVNVPAIVYFPVSRTLTLPPTAVSIVLRAKGDPLSLASIVREEVRAADPDQPIYGVRTMEQKLSASIAPRRFTMILLSAFAGLALLLALAGIYAVMFASVAERTHEVGIRMALGARRADVLRLIAGSGARWIVAGLILGTGGAWGATRLLKSLLATLVYGVSVTDAWTFVLVPLALAATAMLACFVPALRATRVDPAIALRQE